MDGSSGGVTPEQLRVLQDAVDGEHGGLGDFITTEQFLDHATEEAPALFEELDDEWRDLREAEARDRRSRESLVGRLRKAVDAYPTLGGRGFTLSILGGVLALAALLHQPSRGDLLPVLIVGSGLFFLSLGTIASGWYRSRGRPFDPTDRLQVQVIAAIGIAFTFGPALLAAGVLLLVLPASSLESSVFKTLSVSLFVTGTLVSLAPIFLSPDRLAAERLESRRLRFKLDLRGAAARTVRQRLRIDDATAFSTKLTYTDFSGLAEIDDPEREVPTEAKSRLLEKMKRMPGGTVGIAGMRGAGKTTLIRSICAEESTRVKREAPLALVVDAPVRYDARDFILYLFARVCAEVVGRDRVRQMRGSDRPFGFPATNPWALLSDYRAFLGLACLVAGVGVIALSLLEEIELLSSSIAWGVILVLVGYGILVVSALAGRQRRGSIGGPLLGDRYGDDDPNIHTATLRLRQMWFQQSFSSGWSGGFKAPIGVEAGVTASSELAEQQLSLPDIVDLFREFLGDVSLEREIRIGIDEMDKMDEETARRFLNEIKVVFKVPDCFFFISISEDAMSVFERRGLPIRDVFDSSFDEVQHVPRLPFEAARELLERRTVGLPVPFLCLLHTTGGGLPRDLVRAARMLVELEKGTGIDAATARLLGRSFGAKVEGAKIVARSFELEEHTTLFVAWLDRLLTGELTAESLERHCADFEAGFLARLRALPEQEERQLRVERRELQSLATRLTAFAYYAATMLRFFGRFESRDFVEMAIDAEADPVLGAPVDRLATVTQTFAVDINSAWAMLSAFRDDLKIGDEIPFPGLPVPA